MTFDTLMHTFRNTGGNVSVPIFVEHIWRFIVVHAILDNKILKQMRMAIS